MTTDLVLFLGGRLSLFYIFGEIFPSTAKFIQVDIAPDEIGRNRTIDLGIVSDIKAFLTEINGILDEQKIGATPEEAISALGRNRPRSPMKDGKEAGQIHVGMRNPAHASHATGQ